MPLSTVWRTAPITSLTLTWQFVYATSAPNCLKTWQGLMTDTWFLPDRRGSFFLRKGRTRTYKGILIKLIPRLTSSHLMSFVPTPNVLSQERKFANALLNASSSCWTHMFSSRWNTPIKFGSKAPFKKLNILKKLNPRRGSTLLQYQTRDLDSLKQAAKCLWPLIQRSVDQQQLDDELWGRYDDDLKEKRRLWRQTSALRLLKDSCIATCFMTEMRQFQRTRVIFRRVRKIAKTTISFVMSVRLSVCQHGTTRLPLDGFSWNLILEYFLKMSRKFKFY